MNPVRRGDFPLLRVDRVGDSNLSAVRWENLFADLDAQMAEAEAAEMASEVADRTRREVAAFRLSDRLRPAFGHFVGVSTLGGVVSGRIRGVGSDWMLVGEEYGLESLVPLESITGVTGLGALTSAPGSEGRVASKLTLGYAFRGIARDRAGVAITFRDTSVVTGTIDRVGADFFEMAEHAAGEARRRSEIRSIRTVPFSGIAYVRRT